MTRRSISGFVSPDAWMLGSPSFQKGWPNAENATSGDTVYNIDIAATNKQAFKDVVELSYVGG